MSKLYQIPGDGRNGRRGGWIGMCGDYKGYLNPQAKQ